MPAARPRLRAADLAEASERGEEQEQEQEPAADDEEDVAQEAAAVAARFKEESGRSEATAALPLLGGAVVDAAAKRGVAPVSAARPSPPSTPKLFAKSVGSSLMMTCPLASTTMAFHTPRLACGLSPTP